MNNLAHVGDVLAMQARLHPHKIGARDLEREMTFRVWRDRAARLANALLGIGLDKGDRICILAYNCIEWLEIYAATAMAGLIAVPINFRLSGREFQYIVANSEAKAFIVQDELLGEVEAVRADLPVPSQNYIVFGAKRSPGYRAYEDLIAQAKDDVPDRSIRGDDPWTLMYTSGTTGKPKGAVRSHRGSASIWYVPWPMAARHSRRSFQRITS
jgi:fatty-acyl-CoA synthase